MNKQNFFQERSTDTVTPSRFYRAPGMGQGSSCDQPTGRQFVLVFGSRRWIAFRILSFFCCPYHEQHNCSCHSLLPFGKTFVAPFADHLSSRILHLRFSSSLHIQNGLFLKRHTPAGSSCCQVRVYYCIILLTNNHDATRQRKCRSSEGHLPSTIRPDSAVCVFACHESRITTVTPARYQTTPTTTPAHVEKWLTALRVIYISHI